MESRLKFRVEKQKDSDSTLKEVAITAMENAMVTIEGDKEVVDSVYFGIKKFLEIRRDLKVR